MDQKNDYKVSQKIGSSFYVIVISEGVCKNRKTSDKIGAVGISAAHCALIHCQLELGVHSNICDRLIVD